MKSDRLVEDLEKIRDGLYAEQPMTFGTVNAIINLLQYVFCEHQFETKTQHGSPDGPTEYFCTCRKCGAEKIED